MASIVSTDGGRVIAATQRPDGSWRKERRVKDGYTPQEEVPLYESKGKQWASSKPAYPPGLDPKLVKKEGEVKKKKKKGSGGGQAQQPQRAPLAEVRTAPDAPIVRAEEKWETVDGKGRGNKGAKKDHIKEIVIKKVQQQEVSKTPQVQQEPAKKLRNLKKKLKEIEQLEARIKSKELKNPDKDQLSKVARKSEIEDAIEALELEVSSLSVAS